MKNTARSIILLIIALLLSLSALAAEGSGVWWEGMPMTAFRYEGLKNVSADRVDRLLSPYLGQPFSDELFGEMNALLYSQEWVSYVYADALQEGDDQHLVIAFTFSENPMVASVGIEGESRIGRNPLLRAQAISAGDFFTPGTVSPEAITLFHDSPPKNWKSKPRVRRLPRKRDALWKRERPIIMSRELKSDSCGASPSE